METIEIPKIKCKNEDVKTLFRMAYVASLNPHVDGLCEGGLEGFANKTSLKAIISSYGDYAISPFFAVLNMIQRLPIKDGIGGYDISAIGEYIPFLENTFDITIKQGELMEEEDAFDVNKAIEGLQDALVSKCLEQYQIVKLLDIMSRELTE